MVINTNIAALNAANDLNQSNNTLNAVAGPAIHWFAARQCI